MSGWPSYPIFLGKDKKEVVMGNTEKQLKVNAIKNGTVLDHLPSDQVFRIMDILDLYSSPHPVTVGINLDSRSMGKKGIIKMSGRFFRDEELNALALIAPNASVNIIRDFEVIEKRRLTIPETICSIVRCINPMCVTNHENVDTRFRTIIKGGEVSLRCEYCEKVTDSRNMKIAGSKS